MNFKATIYLFAALLTATLFGGCRSAKPSVEAPAGIAAVAPGGEGEGLWEGVPLKARYDSLCAGFTPQWTDVVLNVKLSVAQPSGVSGSARVTMRRGEFIHLSVRMLGFEVAAARIDNDSVRGYVKTSKAYVAESLSSIFGSGQVTLADIQALLLGRPFLAGRGEVTADEQHDFDFQAPADGNDGQGYWLLQPRCQPRGIDYGFGILASTNRLLFAAIDAQKAQAQVMYSNPVATPCGLFASETLLSGQAKQIDFDSERQLVVEAQLRWDFKGARWNTGACPQFNIPRSCRRIPADRLLKML